jgi:hypothetical protein
MFKLKVIGIFLAGSFFQIISYSQFSVPILAFVIINVSNMLTYFSWRGYHMSTLPPTWRARHFVFMVFDYFPWVMLHFTLLFLLDGNSKFPLISHLGYYSALPPYQGDNTLGEFIERISINTHGQQEVMGQ